MTTIVKRYGSGQTLMILLVQPLDPPPYRAIGYSYTYRTYVFQVSQGIALYPPNLPYRSRGEGVAEGIAVWRYTGVSLR